MIKVIVLFFISSFSISYTQYSVDTLHSPIRVGTMANFGFNFHSADFGSLPGIPNCCPKFSSGFGTSISYITQIQYRVNLDWTIGLRAGLFEQPAILKTTQKTITSVSSQLREVEIKYEINANLQTIAAQPFVSYHISDPLQVKAGLWGGILSTKSFTQKEMLVQPETGTFENGKRTRMEQSGTISETSSFLLGSVLGLSYDIPLNSSKTLLLVPEISLQYNFSNFIQNAQWRSTTLWTGISALYNFRSQPYEPPPPAPPPAVVMERVVPEPPKTTIVILDLETVDENGEPKELKTIPITQEVTRIVLPLLPYIFFDEGSDKLSRRYNKEITKNTNDVLDKYETILSVIASRMNENPQSTITLKGCENSNENAQFRGSLAKNRAETIRNVLISIYGIDGKRVIIVENSLTSKKSNEQTIEGQEENSRVEIYSAFPLILSPLEKSDTISKSVITGVKIAPNLTSEAENVTWNVKTEANSIPLTTNKGNNKIEPFLVPLTQEIIDKLAKANTFKVTVNGEDNFNQQFESVLEVPIEKNFIVRQNETETISTNITKEVYNLLLFDYNSSELTEDQKKSLLIIKKRISPNSVVSIKGYTDKSGSEEVNKTLSLNRAKSVASVLGVSTKAEIIGIGSSELLFPNNLPEGRFYSRTVVVEISIENK